MKDWPHLLFKLKKARCNSILLCFFYEVHTLIIQRQRLFKNAHLILFGKIYSLWTMIMLSLSAYCYCYKTMLRSVMLLWITNEVILISYSLLALARSHLRFIFFSFWNFMCLVLFCRLSFPLHFFILSLPPIPLPSLLL